MDKKYKFEWLAFSIIFGLFAGVFCYAFWLSQFFPYNSKRILVLTVMISVFAAFVFTSLIHKLIIPVISKQASKQASKQVGLWGITISLSISAVLFWFGFQGFLPEKGYLPSLLPHQEIEIIFQNDENQNQPILTLTWFTSSLGDVSLDALDIQGWERKGDVLVLQDLNNNHIHWVGKTGESVLFQFDSALREGNLAIIINGKQENINLENQRTNDVTYQFNFKVPFVASPLFPLILGYLTASFIIFCGFLFVIINKVKISEIVSQSIKPTQFQDWEKIDLVLILVSLVITLALRTPNLEALFPLADEYSHLLAAKNFFDGSELNNIYSRSLFIVTMPVVLSIRLFGFHLWAARIVGVVVNSLAIIPLYLIGRRINRTFALFLMLAYSTSPWIIAVSRNIREYGYYPFFFYLILLLLIMFWEKFPEKFIFMKDWKFLIQPYSIFVVVFSLFVLGYAKFIDPASTFRTILPVLLITVVFVLFKISWKEKSNIFFIIIAFSAFLVAFFTFFKKIPQSPNFLVNLSIIKELFAQNSPVSWFYNRWPVVLGLVFVSAVLFAHYLRKKSLLPLLLIALFPISAILFATVFNHYIRPRYFFNLQIWYVLFISIGLYALWINFDILFRFIFSRYFRNKKNTFQLSMFVAAILILACINIGQITLPLRYDKNGFMPITTEYHYDLEKIHEEILSDFKNGDVLIHTIYGSYARWVGEPKFDQIFYYHESIKNKNQFFKSIITRYPHGWIVLDQWHGEEYSKPLEFSDFSIGAKNVKYLGKTKDEHVWRW